MSKFCSNCGAEVKKEAKFCVNCGKEVNHDASAPEPSSEKHLKEYYSPSTLKLIILSTISFGLYDVYWLAKQWQLLQVIQNKKYNSWARAIFSPFYTYQLFKYIKNTSNSVGNKINYSPLVLFIIYLVLAYSYKLPDPWFFISFLLFLPFIPVNIAMKKYLQKEYPRVKTNSGLLKGEIISTSIGLIIFLGAVILEIYYGYSEINNSVIEQENPNAYIVGSRYPEETRGLFIKSCTDEGASSEVCNCMLEYLESKTSFNDYIKIEQEYEKTNVAPQVLNEAIEACIN